MLRGPPSPRKAPSSGLYQRRAREPSDSLSPPRRFRSRIIPTIRGTGRFFPISPGRPEPELTAAGGLITTKGAIGKRNVREKVPPSGLHGLWPGRPAGETSSGEARPEAAAGPSTTGPGHGAQRERGVPLLQLRQRAGARFRGDGREHLLLLRRAAALLPELRLLRHIGPIRVHAADPGSDPRQGLRELVRFFQDARGSRRDGTAGRRPRWLRRPPSGVRRSLQQEKVARSSG